MRLEIRTAPHLMGVAVQDVEGARDPDQGEARQHLHLSPHPRRQLWTAPTTDLPLCGLLSLDDSCSRVPHLRAYDQSPRRAG